MSEFIELKDLYDHIENKAENYKYEHQIADLFKKLRDIKQEAGVEE